MTRSLGATPGASASALRLPTWLREADSALAVSSHILLTGNVDDDYLLDPGDDATRPQFAPSVMAALWRVLEPAGYECAIVVDVTEGVTAYPAPRAEAHRRAADILGGRLRESRQTHAEIEEIARTMAGESRPIALLVENASHLVRNPGALEDPEHRLFTTMDSLAATATGVPREGQSAGLYNVCFWVLRSERDVPSFFAAENRMVRTIPVPLPGLGERVARARQLALGVGGQGPGSLTPESLVTFAGPCEGLTLRAMTDIQFLALRAGLPFEDIDEAVRRYRIGIGDNPWQRVELREALLHAEERLSARVRGQGQAIRRAVDVIIRSSLGLTAAHAKGSANRPRGVLFFAGPTGVGKTELAKAMAELIFGTEDAYVRFDMSEFSSEHADARLIGAPPGYVGHDAGGELTNAIRQRPYSLVLFDEVEKAHPRILDKFLQVLEDGRLTDGRGATVHFSETVLVFTSNAGLSRPSEDQPSRREPTVTRDTPPEAMEREVRAELNRFFREDLNRPELLNRLGDNIVVFRFIGEDVAEEIFDLGVARVIERTREERGAELVLESSARTTLLTHAQSDLSLGGRGVGNKIESALVNPLARALFAGGAGASGQTVRIIDARQKDGEWHLTLG